ncbi:MAG: prepilin-type N-terminal cleavage/methylation domain-containing protein [Candidatus Cloacimonetes bacterium]|nr:prepilin-type N-terminal cleavage/methylation domain-containing protein [Candidatus Cloacimonadota bacterium]
MSTNKAFTLVEIMFAISIFSICVLGVFRLSNTVGKNTAKSLVEMDTTSDVSQIYMTLRKRLLKANDIVFPALKVDSDRLSFNQDGNRFDYKFEDKSIKVYKDQKLISHLAKGIKLFRVHRNDSKLVQLSFHNAKTMIETRIYLENLK